MTNKNIIENMKDTPLVFDGAMGTLIYARGIFINRCFEEISVVDPEFISNIHKEYIDAGAQVIETNTFGANRIKLSNHGIAENTEAINRKSAELALTAAESNDVMVAGSIGPCLAPGQMLTPENEKEVQEAFKEQICILADAGVHAILFETFSNLTEARLALLAASAINLPVILSFAFDENARTVQGAGVEQVIAELDNDDRVHAIGLNCGAGPAPLYDTFERARAVSKKPFLIQPNAGNPREIDGRMLYLATPEYYTEYAKKFIELGARGVGGCCGTTPDHIRMAAKALRTMSGVKRHVEIKTYERQDIAAEVVPMEMKSRLAGKLARGEKITSVEIMPPRSSDITSMLEKARQCHVAGIDAINIPDGPRASARISPMVAAVLIRERVGIEPVLHYCCRDRNLIGMQSDLLGANAAGLSNFLIVTGDPPKLGDYPDATGVFDVDAVGLTRVARNLNHGSDIGGTPINPPTALLLGVGLNPCAVEIERELDRFRRKVEAGAEFAITQPIFDPHALESFLDTIAKDGIDIPIIAGIWPLTSYKNAEFMRNEVPGVVVPDDVMERMSTTETREEGVAAGIEIARVIRKRIAPRVAGFQVSAPFGRVQVALDVLADLQ